MREGTGKKTKQNTPQRCMGLSFIDTPQASAGASTGPRGHIARRRQWRRRNEPGDSSRIPGDRTGVGRRCNGSNDTKCNRLLLVMSGLCRIKPSSVCFGGSLHLFLAVRRKNKIFHELTGTTRAPTQMKGHTKKYVYEHHCKMNFFT